MNINTLKSTLLFAVCLLFQACSLNAPSKETVSASIKGIMPPSYEVVSVVPLNEIPGLFEVSVRMDKQPVVLYMDRHAKYILTGNLMHIESKKNLTIDSQNKIK